jgi:hypothetical protein
MFILLIVVFIYFYRKNQKSGLGTKVFLEIGNTELKRRIFWCKLPDKASSYVFNIQNLSGTVTLGSKGCFNTLSVNLDNVSVSHRDLHIATVLLKSRLISTCVARQIRMFIDTDYYLVFRVVDNNESTIIILRNPFIPLDNMEHDRGLNQPDTLYPDLSSLA